VKTSDHPYRVCIAESDLKKLNLLEFNFSKNVEVFCFPNICQIENLKLVDYFRGDKLEKLNKDLEIAKEFIKKIDSLSPKYYQSIQQMANRCLKEIGE